MDASRTPAAQEDSRPLLASSSGRLRRLAVWVVVLPLLAGVGVVIYHAVAGSPLEALSYRTREVTRGPLESTVTATGTLSALVTVQVGSQVSGTLGAAGGLQLQGQQGPDHRPHRRPPVRRRGGQGPRQPGHGQGQPAEVRGRGAAHSPGKVSSQRAGLTPPPAPPWGVKWGLARTLSRAPAWSSPWRRRRCPAEGGWIRAIRAGCPSPLVRRCWTASAGPPTRRRSPWRGSSAAQRNGLWTARPRRWPPGPWRPTSTCTRRSPGTPCNSWL